MPASSALLTTAAVASASMRPPKLLQPMPTTDTCNPERPRLRYSMRASPRRESPGEASGPLRVYVTPVQRAGRLPPGRGDRLPGSTQRRYEDRQENRELYYPLRPLPP